VSHALEPDAEWNAGDLGCGDLVLELMTRMKTMTPGQLLKLVASDPGAPADIPAWCRMTGHTLVDQEPPVYLIRRKEN
jgi:tRNA 2-thiouridine synthesizing protein A